MTAHLLAFSLTQFASSKGHMMKELMHLYPDQGLDGCITLLIFTGCHRLVLPEHQSRALAMKLSPLNMIKSQDHINKNN